jgi:hypothetical protein
VQPFALIVRQHQALLMQAFHWQRRPLHQRLNQQTRNNECRGEQF